MTIAPRSTAYLVLLIALASFGPLSMSIYTPVMPSVAGSLGASADEVKLTLTTYMLGFAVGQVFYGPLSDRFGRRPVLLAGLVVFALTSAGCAFALGIGQLIGVRFLQGAGAAAGAVIGRALTRDAYEYAEMPRIMSWISLAVNISPAIAPLVGGILGDLFGWRSAFWLLTAFSAGMLAIVGIGLPETNRHRGASAGMAGMLRGAGQMLRDRRFLGHMLPMGFAFGIQFGMLAGTPFILQDNLGIPPREFGLLVVVSVAGFTAGSFFNTRMLGRLSPGRLVRGASLCHIVGLAGIAAFAYAGILTWWSIMLPYTICSFGTGVIVPNANAGAVGLYPRLAGTASSLVGLAQMGIGAVGTVVVAALSTVAGLGAALGCASAACAVPLPLVVALMPFAVACALSARLTRPAVAPGA